MQVTQNYEVKLEIFEGPLDLLVFLVQKNELNPMDIPISLITDQYLQYMDGVGIDNLSHAGEFLVMASRLMRLKARELLPAEDKDELEEMEYELDKAALIQQMMEHQKFKEAANFFRHLETKGYGTFPRGNREKIKRDQKDIQISMDLFEPGIYELLSAYTYSIKNKRRPNVHQIEIDDVTIENQIKKIQQLLRSSEKFLMDDFYQKDPRTIVLVVSFMSMLELTKMGEIHIQQHGFHGPIWIYKKESEVAPHDLGPKDMDYSILPDFQEGLVEFLKEDILKQKEETEFDKLMKELESSSNELKVLKELSSTDAN